MEIEDTLKNRIVLIDAVVNILIHLNEIEESKQF